MSPVFRKGGGMQRRGLRSAQNLAVRMMADDPQMSEHRREMVRATARLIVVQSNLALNLLDTGETREDNEPKLMVSKLIDLSKEIRANIQHIYKNDAEPSDLFDRGDK